MYFLPSMMHNMKVIQYIYQFDYIFYCDLHNLRRWTEQQHHQQQKRSNSISHQIPQYNAAGKQNKSIFLNYKIQFIGTMQSCEQREQQNCMRILPDQQSSFENNTNGNPLNKMEGGPMQCRLNVCPFGFGFLIDQLLSARIAIKNSTSCVSNRFSRRLILIC